VAFRVQKQEQSYKGYKMTREKGFDPKYTDCESGEEVTLNTMATQPTTPSFAFGGPVHTTIVRGHPKFQALPNEKVIGQNGAEIVFGTDRKDTAVSGFGGKGIPSDSMDLVVGRLASINEGKGPDNCTVTGPSFLSDAARIYISRRTDVDLYFGINVKESDPRKGQSGIGIKADQVRMIGRGGIKLVTGKMDLTKGEEVNSLGGKVLPAPQIDLLAGNCAEKLQPIVLGHNLNHCLEELGTEIESLQSRQVLLAGILTSLCSAVLTEPLLSGTKVIAGVDVTALSSFVSSPGYQSRISMTLWRQNYLCEPPPEARRWEVLSPSNMPKFPGANYICSQNVRST